MIGWALGGVLFGVLGDRIGRANTMIITILSYTIFTGLSVLSRSVWDFNVYRFLCGLGVGGQFGIGVALVAEVVPARARPYALGLVQASSAVGNMMAAMVGIFLGQLEPAGSIAGAWRWEFLAGAIPAPLALVVFKKLKEPEQWLKARSKREKTGLLPRAVLRPALAAQLHRRLAAGFAGVVGLWGIGFFSYDLFRPVLEKTFRAQGLAGAALAGKTTTWIGVTSLLQNLGAFFGVYAFTCLTHYTGRRKAFAISFLAAMGMTAYTFWNLNDHQPDLLDDPADGLHPACPVRRLRHLFRRSCSPRACAAPAPASVTTSAASSPPPARSPWAISPAASSPTSPSPCATPASPCAWCSWSVWPPSPSPPKPRASRCRNEEAPR